MPPALGHHQEQLMQTSTVLSLKTHLFLLVQILEGGQALLRHPFTNPWLALGKLPSFLVSKYSVLWSVVYFRVVRVMEKKLHLTWLS